MSLLRRISNSGFSFFSKNNGLARSIFTSPTCNGEVKTYIESTTTAKIEVEEKDNVSLISGVPKEQLESRVVKIFSPAKNAMQSGSFKTKHWAMEFDTKERWENSLMGWTCSADPLGQMRLSFSSKEDAIAFCEKNGWKFYVEEKKSLKPRPKTYGDNFSWNKKIRLTHK